MAVRGNVAGGGGDLALDLPVPVLPRGLLRLQVRGPRARGDLTPAVWHS